MTEPDISQLRASIDEVDDKIIALLNKRSEFVKKVGMTKKQRQKDGQAFIRSGREADLIRRIHDKFKSGTFPAEAAVQLWRMIICASLSLESPLTVTAFHSDSQHDIFWLAREYFGGFTPVGKQPTSRRVLGDVLDGKAEVGVLPLPDDSAEGNWWSELPEGIHIFACVPFMLQKGAEIKALAVARVLPEPTGNDITLISLMTDMDVSQSRLKAAFDKHSLEMRWLATPSTPSGQRAHLIEIKGFVKTDDASMLAIKAEIGASLLAIRQLGAYAVPLTV